MRRWIMLIVLPLVLAGCCTPKPKPPGYPPHYDEPVYEEVVP